MAEHIEPTSRITDSQPEPPEDPHPRPRRRPPAVAPVPKPKPPSPVDTTEVPHRIDRKAQNAARP